MTAKSQFTVLMQPESTEPPVLPQRTKTVIGSLAIFAIAACSASAAAPAATGSGAVAEQSQQVDQLVQLQKLDQRVADIGWRLASRNLAICPHQVAATGIVLHTPSQYDPAWRRPAGQAFAFRADGPAVLAVAQGSPAWQAGLRPNDTVISIDGQPLTPPTVVAPTEKAAYAETNRVMGHLESIPAERQVTLLVQRGSEQMTLGFKPVTACASRFEMATSNEMNANSNGTVVQVLGRLVLEFPNDDDLSFVMAHELAHNILGHNQEISKKRLSTGLSAAWTGSGKVLREYERTADRYGIFMAARAGYDYHRAAAFWKRLASVGGLGAWIAVTHPNPANREKNARDAIADIDRLKAAGQDLLP